MAGKRTSPFLRPGAPGRAGWSFSTSIVRIRTTRDYRTVKPLTMWAAAANLPSFLRFGLRGLLLLWPRAACGRDDTVHPQVLDHLTVVILRMEGADNGDCEAS